MSVRALPSPRPRPSATETPALRPVTTTAPVTPPAPAPRRPVWLAVHLRGWQLHAALAGLDDIQRARLTAQPLAVVDSDRRATLLACNAIAQARGVRPGHSLNASIALCPAIQILPRDLNSEAALLDVLATRCERYTSTVSVEPPNELLLEVRGSIKLFGGIAALIDNVHSELSSLGWAPQIALAPTPQGGLWLARAASKPLVVRPRDLKAALSQIPVSYLSWPAEIELRLARFGVLNVGDLLRLPRAGLSRRIGHERLAQLDHAVGRHRQIRKSHRALETYRDRVHLEFEIETTGLLSKLIENRLTRMQRFLVKRTLATDRLYIDLKHRDRTITPVVIGLASPTSDIAHIGKLMHEQLAQLQLPAPVAELTLRLDRLYPQALRSRELFGRQLLESAHSSSDSQARLLEQLVARLGSEAVQQISLEADYRPEYANRLKPASVGNGEKTAAIPASLAPRPLWLLKSPQALRALRAQPFEDAEIVESGWWDGPSVRREYFRLRSPRGALAWVFRTDESRSPFLHGLFG